MSESIHEFRAISAQVTIVSIDGDHERISEALKAGALGCVIKAAPAVDRLASESGRLLDSSQTVTAMARRVINVLHHQIYSIIVMNERS